MREQLEQRVSELRAEQQKGHTEGGGDERRRGRVVDGREGIRIGADAQGDQEQAEDDRDAGHRFSSRAGDRAGSF